jgi:hypothetical protein
MSNSVASAGELRWFQGIDRKLWMVLAAMALSYAIGLIAVYFAPETRGKPLPE